MMRQRRISNSCQRNLERNAQLLFLVLLLSTWMFYQQHIALYTTEQSSFNTHVPRTELSSSRSRLMATTEPIKQKQMQEQQQQQQQQIQQQSKPSIRYHTCNILNKTVTFPLVPHFIIAGAQKSGTTAFMEFLNEHPQIQASSLAETHFFDWHVPSEMQLEKWLADRGWKEPLPTEDMNCALQYEYSTNFNMTTGKMIHFEKTPSYLFLTRVPKLIASICFWKPKIIVLLRNPMDRAFSHFRMGVRTQGRSFEELIDQEILHLKQLGLSYAPNRTSHWSKEDTAGARNHLFNFSIPNHWSPDTLEGLHWKHYRKMFSNNYLQRGMYVTQLRHWLQYFTLANNSTTSSNKSNKAASNSKNNVNKNNEDKGSLLVLNYERFKKHPEQVFNQLLEFVGATTTFVPAEGFGTLHNHHEDRRGTMRPETRRYLSAVFRPYNEELADILGEEWRGVWD